MNDPIAPGTPVIWPQMTGEAISAALGFSPRWLKKLADEGYVERLENKLFDFGAVALGYIRWLEDGARRNAKTEGHRRIQDLQAKKLAIANAEMLANLIEIEQAREVGFEMLHTVRREVDASLDSLPDKTVRTGVRKLSDGAFDRCEASLIKFFQSLKSGAPVLFDIEDGEEF